MSQQLRCPNGHTWLVIDAPEPAGGATSSCPVCGNPERTVLFAPRFSADEQPDLPPPVVPGYQVLGELGRGGMGVVYQARRTRDDRVVALKVILPERLTNPEVVRRFRREALAASRLSHPNVVSVFESDQEGDTHFLAMEYVPGETLQRLVERHGPLPVALASDCVRQAALGLQHAVDQGLVHRDIKPSNLMMVAPAASPREALPARALLKVLDLGVARVYQANDHLADSLSTLTRDGSVIGTPDYVAPEQLENPHGADTRADLYSLGCTFYFALTGGVPFPGGTLVQKLDRQRWETPPSVDQLRRDVPAPVAAVVRRLMAKHPDDRYRSPGELADALTLLARTGVLPQGHQPSALAPAGVLAGQPGSAAAVTFTPEGRAVLSGGADHVLRLWDAATGKLQLQFGQTAYAVACVASAGGVALAGQGAGVRLYSLADGRELDRLSGHTGAVRSIAVSRDGRLALTGGDDRTARLWDVEAGRELLRIAGLRGRVNGVALSPDGRLALTGTNEGTLRLWDAASGNEVRAFVAPRGAVLAVAMSSDSHAVLSGHFDTTLRLWEVDSGRELRRLSGHGRMVAAVAIGPRGNMLASGGHDGVVRTWDPHSGAEMSCGAMHTGPVSGLAWSPDGRLLASAGADGTVRLWHAPAGD
jgi:WD40 repeat protein/tRNA A-37 threonylcarbamoyl transferase component Bud32